VIIFPAFVVELSEALQYFTDKTLRTAGNKSNIGNNDMETAM
jgi:hypothetical protein